MTCAPVRQESRWSLRKKGKNVLNICKQVFIYGGTTATLMASVSGVALANPTGGNVVGGSATITDTASELQINQHTNRALIEWASFNIDKGETTRFIQPGSNSVALNRVVNSNQLSTINGNLIANGRVVVINPNGVLIGADGNVDTAGFIATSADIDDDAFMGGASTLDFNRAGNIDAVVENRGRITVAESGLAALVAPTVRNSGVIQGNLAKVQLASADTFAIDFYGDGLIQYAVEASTQQRTLTTENDGSIIADGGSVLMTAAAASDVIESVINSSGYVQAGSLENRGGKIVLTGAGATVKVSGKMDVSGQGDADGGEILIGGAFQGKGDLAHADRVEVTETAELYADGGDNGDGGDVILWSDAKTTSRGKYYARGGAQSGNGGLIETSSADVIDVDGTVANTLAPNGDVGYWLLDPDVINLNASGISYTTIPGGTGTSNVDVNTINAALSNVIIQANEDVNFNADVNIAAAGVGLTVIAGEAGVGIDIPDTTAPNVGLLTELAPGTGTINFVNNFIRTEGGDVNFYSGDSITQNNATIFTNGGDINMYSGDIGINNNAALGTEGGNVHIQAFEAGSGPTKTSGDVTFNSTFIDTTSPSAPGIGGTTVTENGTGIGFFDAFNPANSTQVETANGGTITVIGDNKVTGNSVCFAAGGTGCLVPDPVAVDLEVTIDSFTKIYGVLDPTFTWGITSGSLSGGDTLTVDLARILQNTLAGERVGNYEIFDTAHLITGSGLYNISIIHGNLQIIPASLVIQAIDQTKTYGDTLVLDETNPGDYTVTGLIPTVNGFATGDAVNNVTLASAGTVNTASVAGSPYTITPSNATGSGLSNYTITYQTGDLTVNPAALTVTALDDAKIYDAAAYSGGNGVTYSGFVNGETDAVLGGALAYGGSSQGATNVGNYVITPGGLTSSNYTISYVNGNLAITPAALTITADNQSKTYGDTFTFNGTEFSTSGLVGGETLTSATLGSAGAVATAGVAGSPYTITISNATGGTANLSNYNVTYVNGQMTVNPAALTVTANNDSKVYDAVAYSGGNGVTYSGFVNSETDAVLGGALAYGGSSQGATNVGSYVIAPSGLTSSNYTISYVNGGLDITPAALTVTANNDSKVYDAAAYSGGNGVTYSGFVGGETDAVLGGALGYSGTSQGATNVGNYVITPGGLTSGNYNISYVDGSLNITPAALTITANNQSKTYGDTFTFTGNEFGTTGLVGGETLTSATLTSTGAPAGANAGNYVINISNATGGTANLANYNVTYVNGQMTVNPAALTVTALNDSKVYDSLAYSGGNGVNIVGFVNGDTVGDLAGALVYGGTSQGATNVGSYAIAPSGYTSGNYNISYVDGSLNITPAALTITANNQSKTYGDTFTFTGNEFGTTGLVGGETLTSATLTSAGSANTANVNGSPYTINISNATGGTANLSNYNVTYVNGQMTVNPAALTITANNDAKVYDAVAYFGGNGVTYSGFVNGENEATSDLTGTITYGGSSQGAVNAGSYVIAASGQSSNNYAITYVDGQLDITAAALLLVAANNQTKTYGDSFTFNGTEFTPTGLLGTDSVTSATITSAGAVNTANAGNYVIDISNAVGSGLGNYTISYQPGTFTVNKALLTVTADDKSMTYGGLAPTLTDTVTGFVNGEGEGVIDTIGSVASSTPFTADAGVYNDTLNASGYADNNYNFQYVAGDLTINKADLTVTALNDSKIYDGLAYSGGNGVNVVGLVNGDIVGDLGGALAYGGSSQGATNVGGYVIAPSGYTSGNYNISYVDGSLNITPAALTITANNQSKTYGDTFIFTGNEFMTSGLVNGETLTTVTLSSAGSVNTANVDGSPYTINISNATGGTANLSNYSVTYNTGLMTVNKALLTVTADDKSMIYGGSAPTLTATYTGFVNGENTGVIDTLASLASGTPFNSDAGVYNDTLNASGAADNNYSFQYVAGDLTINKATLLGLTNGDSKIYDGLAYSGGNGVNYIGFVNGDNAGDLSGTLSYSGPSQGATNVGNYIHIGGGQSSNNYVISYIPGLVSITPAALTVTANNQSKTYGDVFTFNGDEFTTSGLVNGETLTTATLGSVATLPTASVAGSPYVISIGNAGGGTANLSNYSVTYVNGQMTVNPAALTITANDATKTYGDTVTFAGTEFTTSGLKNGETLASATLSSAGAAPTAGVLGSPYDIDISNATGGTADLNNYSVTYVDGKLTVNPAALTVTANDDSKIYDANPYSGGNGVSYSGFVNGEDENTSDLTGSVAFGGTSQGAVNVAGSPYSITASGLSSDNYTITYNNGQLTISPRKLLVDADDQMKVYGDADPALTFQTFGLVGGDTVASVFTGSLDRAAGENVGFYAINPGTLSVVNNNYVYGFNGGDLQIKPAPLVITANDDSKIADGVPYRGGNGFTISGFKFNDDQSVLYGLNNIDYRGSSQGAVDPGSYVIDPYGKVGARNYTITFAPGTLDITPAPFPFVEIDPLGRPIISVANQAIVLDEPFEEIETLELETNVGISSTSTGATGGAEALAGIEPAAGEEGVSDDPQQLASLEPAAGDDTQGGEADESDEYAQDIACANSFLDNKPCRIEGQQ